MYTLNFTVCGKKNCSSLHCNGVNTYLFVNNKEIVKFKAADSEIVPYPLCLAGLSKDFSPSSLTGLYGYVYDFSVEYRAIKTSKIHNIHAYLMKKHGVIKMFRFIKKCFSTAMTFFNFNLPNVNSLECISMNNQECKIRTERINLNTNEPNFYTYSIKKISAKAAVIQSLIHMLKYVSLMKLKTQMSKYLI